MRSTKLIPVTLTPIDWVQRQRLYSHHPRYRRLLSPPPTIGEWSEFRVICKRKHRGNVRQEEVVMSERYGDGRTLAGITHWRETKWAAYVGPDRLLIGHYDSAKKAALAVNSYQVPTTGSGAKGTSDQRKGPRGPAS